MISKWVITSIYPIYKWVLSHLLTIDANFLTHPSRNLQNLCMHPESHPHLPVDDEHRTPLFGRNTEVISCEKFKQREEEMPKIFDTQRISMQKHEMFNFIILHMPATWITLEKRKEEKTARTTNAKKGNKQLPIIKQKKYMNNVTTNILFTKNTHQLWK